LMIVEPNPVSGGAGLFVTSVSRALELD